MSNSWQVFNLQIAAYLLYTSLLLAKKYAISNFFLLLSSDNVFNIVQALLLDGSPGLAIFLVEK